MAIVTLRNVSNTYPGRDRVELTALNDVSLDVANQEFVVVTGPPGSGKSALLRSIAGLDPTTQCEIAIDGRSVNQVAPEARDVAMVLQQDALYPHFSVFDNLAFGLRRRKFLESEIKRRVNDAAALLGLEQSLAHKPFTLTREHRQRVALARAIVRQPKILLLDEPFAGLDSTARAQMRAEFARLRLRLATTIIYATRDPSDALALPDRLVVMNNGSVAQTGTPRAIYDEPANLFVARFFGEPGMNVVAGTLKQERDSFTFRESDEGTIEVRLPAADRPSLGDGVGKSIVLGIRPEDVQIIPRRPGGEKPTEGFPAIVDLVETVGAEAHVHLQTGAHQLICRNSATGDRIEAGHRVRVTLNVDRAHLFDSASSNRLS